MSYSFQCTKKIEEQSVEIITPLLKHLAYEGRYVSTNNCLTAQKILGDFIVALDERNCRTIELKSELESRTGNFFFETYSDKPNNRIGWLQGMQGDVLWYYFFDSGILYSIWFRALQEWMSKFSSDFPEKRQRRYCQSNETYGICVPITTILSELRKYVVVINDVAHYNNGKEPLFPNLK